MSEWQPPNAEYPPPKADEPALHRAARLGDHDEIRRLIEAGEDIEREFDIGLDPSARKRPATALMVAAGSGDGASVETVRLLLDLGADPKRITAHDSPATFACSGLGWNYRPGGDAERLELLLRSGSLLPSNPGKLHELICDSCAAGDAARVRVLLDYGLSARGFWDADKARAQQRATMETMRRFREEHRDEQPAIFRDDEGFQARMLANEEEMFEQLSNAPWSYEIPLHCAAESGSEECVRMLLAAGADPMARDNSYRTAMYCANSEGVVRALREVGVPIEDVDGHGWSPLTASMHDGIGAMDRIRALISGGADVNATHDRGYTVFMSAAASMERHVDVMRLLVTSGANPHAVSELGHNAFHAAIDVNGEANAEESVRATLSYLRELGTDIEQRTKGGRTPLARAIEEGTGIEVRVLCELGADPNAVCPMRTCWEGEACTTSDLPLLVHAATGTGVHKDKKCEALLRAGADPFATDAEGVRVSHALIAKLCSEGENYEGLWREFFEGLGALRHSADGRPTDDRDRWINTALQVIRPFVESFASKIPVAGVCAFSEEWRREKVTCISLLCAYESWSARGK